MPKLHSSRELVGLRKANEKSNQQTTRTNCYHSQSCLHPPSPPRACLSPVYLGTGRLLKCLQWFQGILSTFWPVACEPKRGLLCQHRASRPYPSVYSGFIFLQATEKGWIILLRPNLLGHQKPPSRNSVVTLTWSYLRASYSQESVFFFFRTRTWVLCCLHLLILLELLKKLMSHVAIWSADHTTKEPSDITKSKLPI